MTVRWSGVKNASFYEVYRAGRNGSYKKIATVRNKKTYVDDLGLIGHYVTYSYKVRAYDKVNKCYTTFSSPKSVRVK